MKNFGDRLKGGHPNSLGNTVEIVGEVLAENTLFDELFNCYFSNDEIVRLRTSNPMKRICKEKKAVLIPYIDRFLTEIAKIDQASTQWTLSQLFGELEKDMTDKQIAQAKEIMKNNLATHNDWIVLNQTMDILVKWSKKDSALKEWMVPPPRWCEPVARIQSKPDQSPIRLSLHCNLQRYCISNDMVLARSQQLRDCYECNRLFDRLHERSKVQSVCCAAARIASFSHCCFSDPLVPSSTTTILCGSLWDCFQLLPEASLKYVI